MMPLARHHHDLAVLALDGLDLAEARHVRSRTDPEQRAVAALDDGAAVVEVAQPPAFGDLAASTPPSAARPSR